MTIEIVDLPIKNGDVLFYSCLLVYQRVVVVDGSGMQVGCEEFPQIGSLHVCS